MNNVIVKLRAIFVYLVATLFFALAGTGFIFIGESGGETIPYRVITAVGIIVPFSSPMLPDFCLWLTGRRGKSFARRERLAENRRDYLRRRFLERERLIDSVDKHRTALIRNLARAIKKNDYGVTIQDTTRDTLAEFFASIELDTEAIHFTEAEELVFEQLEFRRIEASSMGFDPSSLPFDGHAFERWVAEALISFDWKAEVTVGFGDQGLDVIAEKNGKKLGLQCKLYSSPIGNKAIQEAHAGKTFYGVDAAGVLTNSTFTSSAKELAAVTGINLLSHHDIPNLYQKVFGTKFTTLPTPAT